MNLPIFHQLQNDQSTYLSFSKGLNDLDKANSMGTEYHFSHVIALKLPVYENPNFFIELDEVGISSDNPNLVLPKTFQYYMENIIRQDEAIQPEIVELAFWKTLMKMGMSDQQVRDSVVFCNKVVTSNFTTYQNNLGWSEVVAVIPNKCSVLNKEWKNIDISRRFAGNATDDCMWDNGNKEFIFTDEQLKVLDFNRITYDETTTAEFDFNVLLFFYKDSDGVDKLHGINFINNFDNKISYYEMPTLRQRSNDARSIGYQFSLNMKTVNNEASLIMVEEYNKQAFGWNNYFQILSGLNNFLLKAEMKEKIFG